MYNNDNVTISAISFDRYRDSAECVYEIEPLLLSPKTSISDLRGSFSRQIYKLFYPCINNIALTKLSNSRFRP